MAVNVESLRFISHKLQIPPEKTETVLKLLFEQDCTIPFIARYRKEATGNLDEVQVGAIKEAYEEYNEREKRRAYILETIKKMEMLTPDLQKKILSAETLNQLEDLYAPYKSKRKTKAQMAREAGLEPLATIIKTTPLSLSEIESEHGSKFLNKAKKITNFVDALEGARNIIIEEIAHHPELKEKLRQNYWDYALMRSEKKKGAEEIKDYQKYRDYFEFEQKVSDLKNPKIGHRFLALKRGMEQKVLKVSVIYDEEKALKTIESHFFSLDGLGCTEILRECIKKAYTLSLHPAFDLEIKSELKKLADESAIQVFGVNLKNLLLQPYLGAKAVMGIDPGVRTGCKIAIIDDHGKFLLDTVIYPHPPQNAHQQSQEVLDKLIAHFKVRYIAIGNGTYGRETLEFIKKNVAPVGQGKVHALLINEDGASIYSASELARKEFPDKDPTVRGAISIARRFQDPLAELVKIDPKSIGVGQYQHDVNQAKLKNSLASVVESCVNYVGVDLNTASAPLLSYISGIGPVVAQNIVKFREKEGGFKERQELLKVGRFSPKVFEQAAGFLRIYQAKNPLDGTFIHPERYPTLESWCQNHGLKVQNLVQDKNIISQLENDQKLKEELGEFTHQDIVKALKAPSQDPRTTFKSFEYRQDIAEIKDLKVNQWYPGLVTNITQFGAFVDIGIKENGLIHISQMADKFVENPLEILKVGQEVKARVIEVDLERKRIALSLKQEQAEKKVSASAEKTSRKPAKHKQKHKTTIKNNAFASLQGFKVKR